MPIAVAEDGFYPVLVGHYPRAQPTTVHVNPYTAEVMGSLANEERFSNWALNRKKRRKLIGKRPEYKLLSPAFPYQIQIQILSNEHQRQSF